MWCVIISPQQVESLKQDLHQRAESVNRLQKVVNTCRQVPIHHAFVGLKEEWWVYITWHHKLTGNRHTKTAY